MPPTVSVLKAYSQTSRATRKGWGAKSWTGRAHQPSVSRMGGVHFAVSSHLPGPPWLLTGQRAYRQEPKAHTLNVARNGGRDTIPCTRSTWGSAPTGSSSSGQTKTTLAESAKSAQWDGLDPLGP